MDQVVINDLSGRIHQRHQRYIVEMGTRSDERRNQVFVYGNFDNIYLVINYYLFQPCSETSGVKIRDASLE